MREEEVVGLDLAREGVGGDAEVGLPVVEVVVPFGVFVIGGSPGGVVEVGENGGVEVLPGLFKSLNRAVIELLA